MVRSLDLNATSLGGRSRQHRAGLMGRAGADGRLALTLVVVALRAASAPAADPPGTPGSRDALALCRRAQDVPTGEQSALLARSLSLADEAIAADDHDAL